jgi:hypothetical protein
MVCEHCQKEAVTLHSCLMCEAQCCLACMVLMNPSCDECGASGCPVCYHYSHHRQCSYGEGDAEYDPSDQEGPEVYGAGYERREVPVEDEDDLAAFNVWLENLNLKAADPVSEMHWMAVSVQREPPYFHWYTTVHDGNGKGVYFSRHDTEAEALERAAEFVTSFEAIQY